MPTSGKSVQPRRQPLGSPALYALFIASFGGMTSFYLLLSVVPRYAAEAGASEVVAGLTTGALMLGTVLLELATPRIVAAIGYRRSVGAGLVLLGASALALSGATTAAEVLLICLARGAGFAVVVVVGSAAIATAVPPARRGEALGIYGVIVGVPAILALPLGLYCVDHFGYHTVFLSAAVSALVGVAAAPALPRGEAGRAQGGHGLLEIARSGGMLRSALTFSLTAMATGIVVTFLPIAFHPTSGTSLTIALMGSAIAATVGRWAAGLYADRRGVGGALTVSTIVGGVGVCMISFTARSPMVAAGMILLGAAFGIAQAASLVQMFARAPRAAYDHVSALWNLAYDAGLGLGAVAFGVVAERIGYAPSFAVAGLLTIILAMAARGGATAGAPAAGGRSPHRGRRYSRTMAPESSA